MNDQLRKIIFLFLFVLLFFAIRFTSNKYPLQGEEGVFAELIVNRPESPHVHLRARLDGRNIYTAIPPAHPIALYNVIKTAGVIFKPYLDAVDWENDRQITPRLRFVFSFFQFVIFAAIASYIAFYRKHRVHILLAAVFLAVVVSPVAIKSSQNLQVDGSVGVLMNGLVVFAILMILKNNVLNTVNAIILFIAAFFLGTGKQEWSIALLIAMGICVVYIFLLKSKTPQQTRHYFNVLLVALAGMIAGNIYSYILEPVSYTGAFKVMWNFSGMDALVDGQIKTEGQLWLHGTITKLPWICTGCALLAIFMILSLNKRQWPNPIELLLLIFGTELLAGFFIITHAARARYFAPSLVVLLAAVIAIFPQKLNPKITMTIAMITLIMFVSTGIFICYRVPMKPYFDANEINMPPGYIAILDSAQAWNKTNIDFIASTHGPIGFAKKHKRKIYPEDFVRPK